MLVLPIKRKWFDMILSGEKKEEYREIKPYWDVRLCNEFGMFWVNGKLVHGQFSGLEEIDGLGTHEIMFRNGYRKDCRSFVAECSLSIGRGKEEWGAEKNKEYFVISVENIKVMEA